MVFDLFKERILNKKRTNALTEFRKKAIEALKHLSDIAKTENERLLYEQMQRNVRETPIFFYPKKSLKTAVQTIKGKIVGISMTKGEHVNQIKVIQRGKNIFVVRSHYINLPSEHIFEGDKLSLQGIVTLSHEYGHFPKRVILPFALSYKLTLEQAEELLADILAAKLASVLGYPKNEIMQHFSGRKIVYGLFPFKEFIKKAIF